MSFDPRRPDESTVIWRYMDGYKFESMLQAYSENHLWGKRNQQNTTYFNDPGQLWFSFPYSFEDSYEGTVPTPNKIFTGHSDPKSAMNYIKINENLAQLCGVSCWHENQTESKSMWDSFVNDKNGVAVKSTVSKLLDAFGKVHGTPARKAKPICCHVGYVDHSDYFLESADFKGALAIVDKIHSCENEVRVVAQSPSFSRLELLPKKDAFERNAYRRTEEERENHLITLLEDSNNEVKQLRKDKIKGFNLPIELDDVFTEVIVKKGAAPPYKSNVESMLSTVNLKTVPVADSSV